MIYAFDTGRLSRAITDDGVPEISGRLELDSWDCEGIDFQMKFLSKQPATGMDGLLASLQSIPLVSHSKPVKYDGTPNSVPRLWLLLKANLPRGSSRSNPASRGRVLVVHRSAKELDQKETWLG